MSLPDPDVAIPGLRIPTGCLVDWITLDRLQRQLAVAPGDVVAVAAPTGPLPPGASYRTHAERAALRPLTDTELVARAPAGAAVLRRPDGPAGRSDEPGPVLLDHGTHCHDPGTTPPEVLPARPEARSPFPVRPVVLFVACTTDVDERVHRLVDAALAADVEARLAVRTLPPGEHLTRPCAPVAETYAALGADIVVAMDDAARASLDEWGASDGPPPIRVELDERVDGVELGRWRRGDGPTPVRARFHPTVPVDAFATLAVRLASGPRPLRLADVQVT
jgi:hypothetical protein